MGDGLGFVDATEQAAMARRGEVSPRELVDAAIARIEAVDPELHAVIWTCFDEARAAAGAELPDGPLRGVPFLIKDIGANQAGLPAWSGNRLLRDIDHRCTADTVLGARFRAAGLVTLGKTNLPELGSCPTTQPLSTGATGNPWDPTRSPAGSSGGAAAAVASGMVPIAHANDGGGSTRLPASWCGLVGLKTTRGRMPIPEGIERTTSELVVSRTVRDTALVLDATCGHVEADLFHLPPPAGAYVDGLGRAPGPLRVGLLTDGHGYDVDPACVDAAAVGARLLESLGHHVEPVDGTVLFGGDGRVNGQLWMAGIARRVAEVAAKAGREVGPEDIEPYNWAAAERGKTLTAVEWGRALEQQQAWAVAVANWFAGYDLLLTPTSGCPPLPTDELWPAPEAPWRIGRTYGRIGRFTLPFNVTGHPAISLPLHWSDDGLPVGTQLVAHMGREDLLLQVAAELEQAAPWVHRRPVTAAE
jgi:amidase